MQDSLSQATGEQKHSFPTGTNLAYGCAEDFRYTECAMNSMSSGATMATEEPIYEVI